VDWVTYLDEIDLLPSLAGAYALHLTLDRPARLQVGKLGEFDFPAGDYIYLGSARGPGGIRGRLGRHLRGANVLHWHLDFIRAEASVVDHYYFIDDGKNESSLNLECYWSQYLGSQSGYWIPVPGFGASDCPSKCPAHLVGVRFHSPASLSSILEIK
jgi:Uri superfamily endonuclease